MADADLTSPDEDIWTRSPIILEPDPARTVLRPFAPEYPAPFDKEGSRPERIVERLLSVDSAEVMRGLQSVTDLLGVHYRNVDTVLLRRYEELGDAVPDRSRVSRDQALLIGAFFCEEYSFEAAALFNPSIVRHWDQSGMEKGDVRFILSLRGIGEGHVSSVTFRTGVWKAGGDVWIDDPSTYSTPPRIEPMAPGGDDNSALSLEFEGIEHLSEAVLFPMTPSQRQGIEDLRLVRCAEDDGTTCYMGTYTAFSGAAIRQEMLRTEDFTHITMRPLTGKTVDNKGMALFPRRIDGRYAMLSRLDNENIWLMRSDDPYHWDHADKIIAPHYPWEFVQIGNCGSPLEIDEGWLVIIHGVGLVRNYTMSACLLDKKDPSKLLARTTAPILRPSPNERDGYVPNVVYSCGSLLDGRRLLVPYGVADNFAAFASTTVDALLARMA